ncbi:MAG TPA: lipid A deacylase LpxR family protein [Allosphingosinicella sp.]|jgi:hypothetical protein
MGWRSYAVLIAASLPPAGQAQAQMPGELRITEENDDINPFADGKDRYYSQGIRVEWLSRPRDRDGEFLPGIIHADWCRLFCGEGAATSKVNAGFAGGQNMYTPADISFTGPQPNDRPWAGLLYVSRTARTSYVEPKLMAQRQDRLEVTLGILGPASLAKETQTLWHDLWDFQPPNGWDNQLRNEPILQLRYETALRWPQEDGGKMDLIPRLRVNVGNAFTSLEAEVTGRIGRNLSGFGATANPAMAVPAAEKVTERALGLAGARWLSSYNLFLRGGIKAVARNITIDGNTFARDHALVERTTLVPEVAAGVELNLVDNLWLTLQFVRRGSEFRRRNGRSTPAQDFGSITLAWTFGG